MDRTQEIDLKKRQLCEANGVELVEFTIADKMTEDYVMERIDLLKNEWGRVITAFDIVLSVETGSFVLATSQCASSIGLLLITHGMNTERKSLSGIMMIP